MGLNKTDLGQAGIIDGWASYFATAATGTHSETYTGAAAFVGVQ